jgi:phosphoglycerate dehydrogenase-like enzyme
MLGAKEFRMMRDDCVFINTARGAIVDERALIRELKKGRFLAFLDVTSPEPPRKGHPFFTLDNVVLMPHVAGTAGSFAPIAAMAVEEVALWAKGKRAMHPITPKMLAHIG